MRLKRSEWDVTEEVGRAGGEGVIGVETDTEEDEEARISRRVVSTT